MTAKINQQIAKELEDIQERLEQIATKENTDPQVAYTLGKAGGHINKAISELFHANEKRKSESEGSGCKPARQTYS